MYKLRPALLCVLAALSGRPTGTHAETLYGGLRGPSEINVAPVALTDSPSTAPSAAPSLALTNLAGLDSAPPMDADSAPPIDADTVAPAETQGPIDMETYPPMGVDGSPGNDDAVTPEGGADTQAPLDTLAPGTIVGPPTAAPTTRTVSESEVSGAFTARGATATAAGAAALAGLAGYLW